MKEQSTLVVEHVAQDDLSIQGFAGSIDWPLQGIDTAKGIYSANGSEATAKLKRCRRA